MHAVTNLAGLYSGYSNDLLLEKIGSVAPDLVCEKCLQKGKAQLRDKKMVES